MTSLITLFEGYGWVYSFDYKNPHRDPNPRILWLGRWRNPATKKVLMGSINLNGLSPEEIVLLRKNLPTLLADRNLKRRYWTGRALMPEVFKKAYRTYDEQMIGSVKKDTITAVRPTDDDVELAIKLAQDEGHAIDSLKELPEHKQLEFLDKAVIDRVLKGIPTKGKKRAMPKPTAPVAPVTPPQAVTPPAPIQQVQPPGITPPIPGGMQPMTPDLAIPQPSPQIMRPDDTAKALKGEPMPPSSPERRRVAGKKEPGREAPQAPQQKPSLPTDLTSAQRRRGAAKAVERKQKQEFNQELDKQKESDVGPG